jgi:radical SAM superfamily enzyme YgiQ (UPF0313 family)
LEKLGHDVWLYDASVVGDTYLYAIGKIRLWDPEVIAYYWSYDTRAEDLKFAEILAHKNRVILVGPWSTHYPEALKDCPSVEAMTWGQFEYTLPELIYEKKGLEGVTYRDGSYKPHGEAYGTAELDWMPFVSSVYHRKLDLNKYHQTSFRHPFVDLYTSRGCVPGTCTFCSVNNGENKLQWRSRSLSNVMEELWYIKNNLPYVKQIFFQDDTLPTPWALKISQQIIDEKLDICWGCYSRADKNYDEIMKLKEAGCRTFHVGYEVPIQSILDEIRKGITVEQMEIFAKAVRKAGMWTSSSFMVYPWMTDDQLNYTIKWIKDTKATRVNIASLQAYPGCPITGTIKAYESSGKKLMSWEDMVKVEQRGFREFYLKNPEFWIEALRSPREWKELVKDAWGMIKFLRE